LAKTSV